MLANEFKDLLNKALDGDQTALENWSVYLESNLLSKEEIKNALELIDNALTLKTHHYSYALALRADMYREGQGSNVNYKKAIKLYEKSYLYGNSYGRTIRAHMHRLGLGGERDYQAASWHYEVAIKQGNCQAMFYRALMFENGMGSYPNYEKAISLYTHLASLGYTEAILGQARLLFTGIGCKADVQAAISLYEQATRNDKTGEAHNTFASIYSTNNPEKAIALCEQAIVLGNTNAMMNLGPLYLKTKRTSEADYFKTIELCYQSYITNPSLDAIEMAYNLLQAINERDESKQVQPDLDQPKKQLSEKLGLMLVLQYEFTKDIKNLIDAKKLLSLPNLIVLINEEIVKRLNTIPSSSKIGATVTQALIDFAIAHHGEAAKECPQESDLENLISAIYRGIENNLRTTEDHRNTERLIDLLSLYDPDYKLTASKNLRVITWLHNGEFELAIPFYIDELTETSPFTSDELQLLATEMLDQLGNFALVERNRRIEIAGELYYQAYLKSNDESSYRYFINLLHNKEFYLKGEKEKYTWTMFDPQNETEKISKVKNDFLSELKEKKLAIYNFTNYIKGLETQTSSFFSSKEKIINRNLAKEILSQLKLHIPLLEVLKTPRYSARISKDRDFSALIAKTVSNTEIYSEESKLETAPLLP